MGRCLVVGHVGHGRSVDVGAAQFLECVVGQRVDARQIDVRVVAHLELVGPQRAGVGRRFLVVVVEFLVELGRHDDLGQLVRVRVVGVVEIIGVVGLRLGQEGIEAAEPIAGRVVGVQIRIGIGFDPVDRIHIVGLALVLDVVELRVIEVLAAEVDIVALRGGLVGSLGGDVDIGDRVEVQGVIERVDVKRVEIVLGRAHGGKCTHQILLGPVKGRRWRWHELSCHPRGRRP